MHIIGIEDSEERHGYLDYMSWDNEQDDFYKQNEDDFWNRNDDAFWDSDERYIRKDEEYRDTYEMPERDEEDRNEYEPVRDVEYGNVYEPVRDKEYNSMYDMLENNKDSKTVEYKRNSRILLKFVLVCAVIMIVAVVFTVVSVNVTRNTMERKIKELDYDTHTYATGEELTINECMVTVSDAYLAYDSSDVWMPAGKMLIGVYVEAIHIGDSYDGGVENPYLGYDGHYVYPVTDQTLKEMLMREGLEEEQFLDSYYIGSYGEDAGYYFFLVDEGVTDYVFVMEEREKDTGRVEYLRDRYFVELKLDE